jgi:pyruvate/2-oxoacid:ferredoxin oxidoreductase alpha subunit
LGKAAKVVVIDRNMSPGLGGVFASEIKAALYALENRPLVYPVIAGLGGRDVTPEDVEGILGQVLGTDQPPDEPIYWSLKQ